MKQVFSGAELTLTLQCPHSLLFYFEAHLVAGSPCKPVVFSGQNVAWSHHAFFVMLLNPSGTVSTLMDIKETVSIKMNLLLIHTQTPVCPFNKFHVTDSSLSLTAYMSLFLLKFPEVLLQAEFNRNLNSF